MLHFAELNNFEQIYYLLERGADYTIKGLSGGTVPSYVFNATIDPQEFPELYAWQQKCRQFLETRGVKNPGKSGPTKEQIQERDRMIREAFERKRRQQQGQQ